MLNFVDSTFEICAYSPHDCTPKSNTSLLIFALLPAAKSDNTYMYSMLLSKWMCPPFAREQPPNSASGFARTLRVQAPRTRELCASRKWKIPGYKISLEVLHAQTACTLTRTVTYTSP